MSTEISTDVVVDPQLVETVNTTVAQARALTVATPGQAEEAVSFLAQIADAKRSNEDARVRLVKPLNDHVKTINKVFKDNASPLDEADNLVRGKVLAYQKEEQRRQAEEQARLDAQRREQEAAAEAERRAQAQRAAEAERVAREQAEARQAKLREAQNERAREIAAMSDEALDELLAMRLRDGDPEHAIVNEEIQERKRRREADEKAAETRRIAEEATQREIAAKSAPPPTAATVTSLSSVRGKASVRQEWKGTVVDESQIPREYLTVDTAKINKVIKAGVRTIPGVRIEQVAGLAVRTGR